VEKQNEYVSASTAGSTSPVPLYVTERSGDVHNPSPSRQLGNWAMSTSGTPVPRSGKTDFAGVGPDGIHQVVYGFSKAYSRGRSNSGWYRWPCYVGPVLTPCRADSGPGILNRAAAAAVDEESVPIGLGLDGFEGTGDPPPPGLLTTETGTPNIFESLVLRVRPVKSVEAPAGQGRCGNRLGRPVLARYWQEKTSMARELTGESKNPHAIRRNRFAG